MEKIKIGQVITRMDWGGSRKFLRIICEYLDPDVFDVPDNGQNSMSLHGKNPRVPKEFCWKSNV